MNESTVSNTLSAQEGQNRLIHCVELKKNFMSKAETLQVLKGVNLELGHRTTCSITGSSGSGKSTLLAILGGLEQFDSGEVEIGGYRLHELSEKDLPEFRSRYVGFVFQFHYLLKDFTAVENVALPAYMSGVQRKDAWGRAETLLENVGLKDRMHHYPSELSGGERQRTAIARAMINAPKLILADEPTGNLDASHAAAIRDLLLELPRLSGASVVLATHDPDIALSTEHRYLLRDGNLVAQ